MDQLPENFNSFLNRHRVSSISGVEIAGQGAYSTVYKIKAQEGTFALKVTANSPFVAIEPLALEAWSAAGTNTVKIIAHGQEGDNYLTLMPFLAGNRLVEMLTNTKSSSVVEPYLEEMAEQQALMHTVAAEGFGSPRISNVLLGTADTLQQTIQDKFVQKIREGLRELKLLSKYEQVLETALSKYASFDNSSVLCHGDYSLHSLYLQNNKLVVTDPNPMILPSYIDVAHTFATFLLSNYLGRELGALYIWMYNQNAVTKVQQEAINNHLVVFFLYKIQKWYRGQQTKHGKSAAENAEQILQSLTTKL